MARVALDAGEAESNIGVVAGTERPVTAPHLSARRRRTNSRDTTHTEKSTSS